MGFTQNVVSILTRLAPAVLPNTKAGASPTLSTFNGALSVCGAGVFADRLGPPQTDTANGVYVFDAEECTGNGLVGLLTGGAGVTAFGRVCIAEPLFPLPNGSDVNQWTHHHVCDLSLVRSGHPGIANGLIDANTYYATITVTNDAGLLPLGTRAMTGLSSVTDKTRVIMDGVCWPRVVVQVTRNAGTATAVGMLSDKWTRS